MKTDITILSREIIKPSTPTPPHLKNFKISLLDQLAASLYIPITLFYTNNTTHPNQTHILSHLKKSLSQTLTRFYPLAGRIKDPSTIECNDDGVLFSEGIVNCHLSEFLEKPNLNLLNNFISCSTFSLQKDPEFLVSLQVTTFECGGMVIGSGMFHRTIDGTTMGTFLNSWAQIAHGCDNMVYPDFTTAPTLFPAVTSWPTETMSFFERINFEESDSFSRRFVFDAEAITALKAKSAGKAIPNPTRIEALTGFIWKRLMAASKVVRGTSSLSAVTHSVNMRRRIDPPLTNYILGNLIMTASAFHMTDETKTETDLTELVEIIREALNNVDSNAIKQLQGEGRAEMIIETTRGIENQYGIEKVNIYKFTSWCNMGLYDVDFGWGKPIWIGQTGKHVGGKPSKRGFFLLETRSGDGIELWMTADEQEMGILENDPEFLAYASPNPSVPTH